jgi:hypothetical protein
MRVVLEKLLRDGNMDIYQISRTEVVCFAFHDDLLFLSVGTPEKLCGL